MSQIKPLCAELQQVANDELGEVPARIPADLKAIKVWLEQQPHLTARTDDQFLIQFLRGCKYSLERTKEKLDNFYTLKTKFPDLFGLTDVKDAKLREIFHSGCYVPLPRTLNENGPRIIFFRCNYNVNKQTAEETYSVFTVMHEIFITDDPYACIHGLVYVIDLAGSNMSHFLQMTPSIVKKFNIFYEKSLPLRFKSIYYINVPSVAEQFLKLVLSVSSEKIRKRIHICGRNMEELHRYIPKKYLPTDYGGENGTIAKIALEYDSKFDEYQEYFKQNAQLGTNEKLRPGKPIDFDGMFGMGGSFRKLDVD